MGAHPVNFDPRQEIEPKVGGGGGGGVPRMATLLKPGGQY